MKEIFGTVVALVLLALYCVALSAVVRLSASEQPNDAVRLVLTLVGGLVSALVVAITAATPPGSTVPQGLLPRAAGPAAEKAARIVAGVYLAVWLVSGLALWVALLGQKPPEAPIVADIAKNWLGIAVAAGYAYLGVKPQPPAAPLVAPPVAPPVPPPGGPPPTG